MQYSVSFNLSKTFLAGSISSLGLELSVYFFLFLSFVFALLRDVNGSLLSTERDTY